MGLRAYLQGLPRQSLPARRRFVVLATSVSFLLIVLAWLGALSLGRTGAPAPAPPSPLSPVPSPSPVPGVEGPLLPDSRVPPTPLLDVEALSTDLLKAFGSPSPRP